MLLLQEAQHAVLALCTRTWSGLGLGFRLGFGFGFGFDLPAISMLLSTMTTTRLLPADSRRESSRSTVVLPTFGWPIRSKPFFALCASASIGSAALLSMSMGSTVPWMVLGVGVALGVGLGFA